jgi:glucose-6-phosphate isomerase
MAMITSADPTRLPAWPALAAHAVEIRGILLRQMFAEDPARCGRLTWHFEETLLADCSKQRVTAKTLDLLHELARQAGVARQVQSLFAGDSVNVSEGRAALHMALRADAGDQYAVNGADVMATVLHERERMHELCTRITGGGWRGIGGQRITDVVNLGIGGSDLGPRMATRALTAWHRPGVHVHFVSNVDAADLAPLLARLDPQRTLFIVASKTFTTQETLCNARSARAWLTDAARAAGASESAVVAAHFVAVTANTAAAAAFGIPSENTLGFWDWVGGRYSLWSAVGLPLALAIGMDGLAAMLRGARAMDLHFRLTPYEHNLPLNLALIDIWNSNFLGAETHAVIPYSRSCDLLPSYLQQLEMESNGKSVDRDGQPLPIHAAPIVWGSAGTDAQHAYLQLMHQGGRLTPADFIAFAEADFPLSDHHDRLLSCCFAQTEALMNGKSEVDSRRELAAAGLPEQDIARLAPHRVLPGNQPTTTLLLKRLTPESLGALIALYEHKTFAAAAVWGINPFDQWGVELGKQVATRLLPLVQGEAGNSGDLNASTRQLIAFCRRHRPH